MRARQTTDRQIFKFGGLVEDHNELENEIIYFQLNWFELCWGLDLWKAQISKKPSKKQVLRSG